MPQSRRLALRTYLTGDLLYDSGQEMFLGVSMLGPGSEPSELAIVAVVGEPHLWSDQKDLASEDDDPTVEDDVLVYDGPGRGTVGGRRLPSTSFLGVSFDVHVHTPVWSYSHANVADDTLRLLTLQDLAEDLPGVHYRIACPQGIIRFSFRTC